MQIGRFEVIGELGRGTEGVVYRAVDQQTNAAVALKWFSARLDSDQDELHLVADRAVLLDLSHPAIARILDVGTHDMKPYVVSELVAGEHLDAERVRGLDVREKLVLAVALASGLSAAHRVSLLHTNLRPSNVLVTSAGQPKIVDFALFEATSSSGSEPILRVLETTAAYRAPEQFYGKRADQRTDVFCLGILLHELFTGQRPFVGATWIQIARRILHDNPRVRASHDLPDDIGGFLSKALERDPLDRFQTAEETLAALQSIKQAVDRMSVDSLSVTTATEQSSSDTEGQAYLVIDEGERERVVPLRNGQLTIGRKGENDLPLVEEHISRQHCAITRTATGYWLVDSQSKHGTYHNGVRINKAALSDGDRIGLGRGGKYRITFRIDSRSPAIGTTSSNPLARGDVELLLDVMFALNSSLAVDAVLNIIMDSALTLTAAERGFIMLQEDDGHFSTRVRRNFDPKAQELDNSTFSRTAVQRCLASQQPLFVHDMQESPDLASSDSVADRSLQSILCLPLMFHNSVLGVLYMDSREVTQPFRSSQVDLLLAFASQAALALENAHLYELATVDRVTGVYLRHHFETRLDTEFRRAQRYGSSISLLFIDVDEFKKVNDNFGHVAGDRFLRAIARTVTEVSRHTDIVAKFGGDEFVLLAPESSLEMALTLAERIRQSVRTFPEAVALGLQVTVSIGVATYPGFGIESVQNLVRVADDAVLTAKKNGRDQVVVGSVVTHREGTQP